MRDSRSVIGSGLTLSVIAAICAALVAGTWQVTHERIAANARAFLEQSLVPALGNVRYDAPIGEAVQVIDPPHDLPGDDPVLVYRAYAAGEPVAVLFAVTAPDGYAGPIRVLVGIRADGTVAGLRILEHRETPGLGDGIDHDRSDWSLQFTGRSLMDPAEARWAIRSDGGDFDQLTGASVTPRAVVGAVRDTLIYFDANRNALLSAQAPLETD